MENINLPKRKSTRLKEYDYSSTGVYFVTVCVKDRKALLSKIVGEGLRALPQTQLANIGLKVKDAIEYIDTQYQYISIDNYVIMPNHIHLLVRYEPPTGGHGDPPLQDVIARLKSFTTHQYGKTLWQRSFIDHIIRNERDYIEHYTYIENNHLKWELDDLY
ncbi:MAG: transposase [Ruminococcus sp.]|nr:transposase [Ruminococcus sp.]